MITKRSAYNKADWAKMYPNNIFWTKFIFHCSISLNFSKLRTTCTSNGRKYLVVVLSELNMQTYLDAYPKHVTLGNTMRNTANIFFNLKFGIIFQNKINYWIDWNDIPLPMHAKIECFSSIFFFLRILIFKVARIHDIIYRTRSINKVCLLAWSLLLMQNENNRKNND